VSFYVLSPHARADIEAIWDFTAKRWGLNQAEFYVRGLQTAIEAIAADWRRGRACDEVRPGYRKFPAGSHVVFYRRAARGIDVVRILHERMDSGRHL
jgi:toxin ParE1/3/4